ncbi:hypothetical protein [Streptomyces lushanensis]|uniref:hypothetical protein n=1 Tax=Streptomyces lushanensis TaxID=1434255 RepID=UPI00082B36DC|nr:hypothetical protein [Streptomyces lushanensis]
MPPSSTFVRSAVTVTAAVGIAAGAAAPVSWAVPVEPARTTVSGKAPVSPQPTPGAPAQQPLAGLLGGLPLLGDLLGGLSDRNAKTDVTPVRWDR